MIAAVVVCPSQDMQKDDWKQCSLPLDYIVHQKKYLWDVDTVKGSII